MEMVDSFKFLDIQITCSLTWSLHTAKMWHAQEDCLELLQVGCKRYSDRINLSLVWQPLCSPPTEPVVKIAQSFPGSSLHSTQSIFMVRWKVESIVKDACHPGHSLFYLLSSGRRYNSLKAWTSRQEPSSPMLSDSWVKSSFILHSQKCCHVLLLSSIPHSFILLLYYKLLLQDLHLNYNLAPCCSFAIRCCIYCNIPSPFCSTYWTWV